MTTATAELATRVGITVEPINGFIGAELKGVDLSRTLSDDEFAVIHDAFVRYEVIVMRNQNITFEQQMAFGERFGQLTVHPFAANHDDHRELIVFDNTPDNPPVSTDCWHSDETFRACPPTATILRCVTAPQRGGDTLFSSMTAAYRGLSEDMQRYLHAKTATHDFKPWRPMFNTRELRERLWQIEERFPTPHHPVIRVHPVTGRRVLFVNSQFTNSIDGLKPDESAAILDYLYRQASIPEYQLRVKWEPNMMVAWDNRSTQHYASYDYYPQPRKMERVTTQGEPVLGVEGAYEPERIDGNGMIMPKPKKPAGGRTREFERL